MTLSKILYVSLFISLLALSSCKKKETQPAEVPASNAYTIPSSYNFTKVNFTSSTQQIDMLGELTNYVKTTHTSTTATQPILDAKKLRDMYANVNNAFESAVLNASAVQLKAKTSTDFAYPTLLENLFDEAQIASDSAAKYATSSTASNGVKGKLISPSRAILVNANGFEYKELVEKGIMGAVFYYQATHILNTIDTYNNYMYDNGTTAQEKAWDEAFGYFGVPIDFPTNTSALKNWGAYANSVNSAIGCNAVMMDAFLKGRAAISNKDNEARNAAAARILSMWEKVAAAKCIVYLKSAKANLIDNGASFHALTEAYGFVSAFKYNSTRIISNADITSLQAEFGGSLYTMSQSNIDNAINKLASVFSLDTSKL